MNIDEVTGMAIAKQETHGDQVIHNYAPQPAPEPGDEELLRAFATSLHSVAADCSQLVTRGLTLGGGSHQKPLRLAHVYVSLDTKSPRPSEKEDSKAPAESRTSLSALEVLFDPEFTRIVLVGEPGSGKSTFLQYVTLCLADSLCVAQSLTSQLDGWKIPESLQGQKLAPLRVLLREFAPTLHAAQPAAAEDVVSFLRSQLSAEAAARLPELLKRGRAFVLFDGLDEVPKAILPAVQQAITSFAKRDYAKCRIAVTCRTESYKAQEFRLPGFPPPHEIAPLSFQHRDWFVHAWYRELEEVQKQFKGQGAACAASLLCALATDRLREMAGNPFFLTAMAALHRPDKPLPDTSAELMHRLVDGVLEESRRTGTGCQTDVMEMGGLLKQVNQGFKDLRWSLQSIAYAAREKRQDHASRFVDEDLLRARLALGKGTDREWVSKVLQALLHRAGLLQSQDGTYFEFAYRFEEFLAGCHLANQDAWANVQPSFATRARDLLDKQGDYARQAILWAAGVNAHVQRGTRGLVRELVSLLVTPPTSSPQPRRSLFGWIRASLRSAPAPRETGHVEPNLPHWELAADIACDAGMEHWSDAQVPNTSETVGRLRAKLEEVRNGVKRFDIKARAQAASAIGRLGDPRDGVGLREDGLPDLAFDGVFPTGEITLAENHQRVTITAPYRLSCYPVTVAQYQAFVAAGGYEDDGSGEAAQRLLRWWGKEGLKWKRDRRITGPEGYDPVFQTPNHPRVGVSWYEAAAFCRWLTERLRAATGSDTRREEACAFESDIPNPKSEMVRASSTGLLPGQEIRLPHEAEWEQAARWNRDAGKADERRYPWGGKEEKDLAQRCNMSKSGIGHTSAVGLFPSGKSDCGAMDLSGNVWEWCENLYRENQEYRVLRGGSWVSGNPGDLSCSCRDYVAPDYRYRSLGFRCVVVLGGSAPR